MSSTATTAAPTRTSSARARPAIVIAGTYFVLAVVGLIGTWYYNFLYTGGNYLGDWFANPASSSAAVDIIVVVAVATVVYLVEGARLGWPVWVRLAFVPLSIAVAVAFALPLFLGLRELALARRRRAAHALTA